MSNGGPRSRVFLVRGSVVVATAVLVILLMVKSRWLPRAQANLQVMQIREPEPMDSVLALLNAFDHYPLVALSEAHGLKEEAEFIESLIRHPDFPKKVNVVVLEAGNAIHQKLIDGYVNGDAVALDELRRVW